MERYMKAKAGDEQALAALFRLHAPLVQSLARRFEQMQDAFQAGCVGLMKAIRRFDAQKGCAFSTYAVPVILGEMRCIREKKYSWRQQKKWNAARQFRDEQMKLYGKEPTVQQMAEKTGIPAAELVWLLEQGQSLLYLDARENATELADPMGDAWMQRLFIRDILDRMPREYSYILRHRFIQEESQQALSERMHMHQSTLSRNEKKARLMFISAWQG